MDWQTIRINILVLWNISNAYGINILGIEMASRFFSTEEIVSFIMDDEEPQYDDPDEPFQQGIDEEFECLEDECVYDNGR